MDKRDFTVIENETKIVEKQPKKMVVTNPIAKKIVILPECNKYATLARCWNEFSMTKSVGSL